jgi:Na+-translocating ferredoxin:NAD+ oxidoreductase subunit B
MALARKRLVFTHVSAISIERFDTQRTPMKNARQEAAMATDVYEALARHLDNLPAGFARTEKGAEMRILRRLFTPEDAELAVHVTLLAEEARVIARRAGIPVSVATSRLEEMDRKGLIMRMQRKSGPPRYMASQYAIGFWEAQVNRLTPELVQDAHEYESAFIDPAHWRKAPQMRTIPVGKSIDVQNEVMPYEMAEELMRTHTSRAVSNCICRQARRLVGEGCDKPQESCLTLGDAADYIARSGRGRKISLEESLEILQRADETGLVLQPDNAKDPLFMCTCCGCCCGVLHAIKRDQKPGRVVSSPFLARLDVSECKGCGLCVKRCQMEAIRVAEKKAFLDVDRCIGCGLCVSTCPTHSLSLTRKPAAEQADIPKDHIKSVIKLARARGKLGIAELVGMQVKSKLDRLLAPM